MSEAVQTPGSGGGGEASLFNPKLFAYEPGRAYAWQVFDRITIATVTWNRLDLTQRFLASVQRHSKLPYSLLVVDNASTDGTVEYLRSLRDALPDLTVIENSRNRGLIRALQQIRDAVDGGLVVYCDNDMEVLTNYWLVLVQKAFHAVRLRTGSADAALGLRVINLDEYGFRYASRREILKIPGEQNDPPRTSYASASKDAVDSPSQLREEVLIGWTEHLMGGAQAIPAAVFKQLRLEDCYPLYIGGTDAFMSAELQRLGVPAGYIENGPVVRHNDWPYTEEKLELYRRMTSTRAVTDRAWLRWKFRSLAERLFGGR